MNKKGSVGAPRKPIVGLTVKPLSGRFTIAQLAELNKGVICELTIRKTVEAHVEGKYRNLKGKITGRATPRLKMLKVTEKQDGVGRPSFVYTILGRVAKTATVKATRKAKTVSAPEMVSTPVVTIPPVATPVPATAPTAVEHSIVTVAEVPAPETVSEPAVTEGSEIPAAFAEAAS